MATFLGIHANNVVRKKIGKTVAISLDLLHFIRKKHRPQVEARAAEFFLSFLRFPGKETLGVRAWA